MTGKITTISSTGDAGAARGALEAADELGLKVGGWTAVTALPAAYTERLRPTLAPRMAARLNVQDSDATLIVSFAPALAAGSPAAYADEAIEHQRKPSLHIILPGGSRSDLEDARKAVLEWIAEEKITTLHVTGPREAEEPGVQQSVRDALVWIFEDEVQQPSPRVQAFAEQVIGPMVAATFAGVDRSAAPEPLQGGRMATDLCKCGRARWEHDMWGNGPCEESGCGAFEPVHRTGDQPTRIAINPANVNTAIAAGLEVQRLHPPEVPAEVYAERDRPLGVGLPGDDLSPIAVSEVTQAGRMEAVLQMVDEGHITQEQARSLLEMPQIDPGIGIED